MITYPKIQSIYRRYQDGPHKGKFIFGEFTCPEFRHLFYTEWIMTEKVDGTNIRMYYNPHIPCVDYGGRTERANIPAHLMNVLTQEYGVDRFKDIEHPMTFFGEGYGAKIQKGGGNYSPTPKFVLFDVRCEQWWLRRDDVENVAEKCGMDVVPIVEVGDLGTAIDVMQNGGFNSKWGDFPAEGVVCTPAVQLFNRRGERIITKIKTKDFE